MTDWMTRERDDTDDQPCMLTAAERTEALREIGKLAHKRAKLSEKMAETSVALASVERRGTELFERLFGFSPTSWAAPLPAEPLLSHVHASVWDDEPEEKETER